MTLCSLPACARTAHWWTDRALCDDHAQRIAGLVALDPIEAHIHPDERPDWARKAS